MAAPRSKRAPLSLLLLASSFLGAAVLAAAAADLEPLVLKLPDPPFTGTPKDVPTNSFVEPLSNKPRPPMMVPVGLNNLAPAAKLSSSDPNATPDVLARITDGIKDPRDDENLVHLRKSTQWVQLDLGSPQELFAVAIWHTYDSEAKIYRDVIVQTADDPAFTTNVRTLFNNDRDNSSGRGQGENLEYIETHEGKLINAQGVKTRYLRFYSKGSTESVMNLYTEIEVYGRPAK